MRKLLIFISVFMIMISLSGCRKGNENGSNNVPEEPEIVYAQVEGTVVYYFNKYKGNVADSGSKVVLLKVVDDYVSDEISEKILRAMKNPSLYYEGHEDEFAEYGLFMAKVNSKGEYVINNVPNGKYTLYIHSNHVDTATSIPNTYKVTYDGFTFQVPFSKEQTYYYGFDKPIDSDWFGLFTYMNKQITISGTSYSCGETDFGMVWSGDYGTCNPWF